jgi:hypothetical protein
MPIMIQPAFQETELRWNPPLNRDITRHRIKEMTMTAKRRIERLINESIVISGI